LLAAFRLLRDKLLPVCLPRCRGAAGGVATRRSSNCDGAVVVNASAAGRRGGGVTAASRRHHDGVTTARCSPQPLTKAGGSFENSFVSI
jgi:hypothetical protein